ncbi:protein-serine/threonine phosphatase [Balamuthia mandrillaris]
MMHEQTEEEAEKKRARMESEEQKENVMAPLDMSDTARPSPPRQSPRIEIKISRADSYEKDLRPSSAEVEEAKEAREHSRSRSTERTKGEEEEGEEDGSNERRKHGTKEKGTADTDRARQRRRQMEIRELARSGMATAMSKQAQKKKGNRANTKATSGQGEGAQIRTGSEGSNTSGRVRSRVLGFKRRHTITVAVSPQTVRSLPTSPVSVTGLSSLRSLEDAMAASPSASSSSSSAARRGRRSSAYSGAGEREAARTKRSTAAGGIGGLLQGAKNAKGLKKSATLDVQGRHLLMTKLKEEKQRRMREEEEEEEDEVKKENRSDGVQQSSTAMPTSLKDEMSIEPKEKEREDDCDDDSKKAESSYSIEGTVDVKKVENTMTEHQSQNSDSNTQQEASSSVSSSSSMEAGESTNQVVERQPFIQIRCGVYSMQGRRKHMEDMHECHPSLDLAGLTASGSFPSQSSLDASSEDSEEDTSPLSSQYGGTSQSLSLDDSLQNNSNNNSEREDEDNISEELKRSFEDKMQAPLLEGNDSAEGCTAAPLCAFFGVYDGHGGKRASEFVARVLHEKIMNHPSFGLEPGKHVPTAIKDAFLQTEDEFMKLARASNIGDGTTAIVAFILKTTLFLGNVGDSEAMLCRDNKAIFFREMVHNPAKNPLEITRIEKVGGRLYHNRLAHPNLNPAYFSLGVSRSIGDSMFKNPDYTKGKPSGLTAEADVQQIELTANDQFLVLACDGLWDVMDHQVVADFVLSSLREKDDPQAASQELVEEAYRRGSTDNITAVVCAFKELKEPVYEEDTEEEELSQERERLLTTTQEEEFESDSGSVKELEEEEEEEMMHQEVEEH